MKDQKKIYFILTMFVVLLLVGMTGYKILLNVSFIDALYMTVITISTVGYQEVAEMTEQAKIFSMIMIFWGVGTAGYTFTSIMIMLIESGHFWRDHKMENYVKKLSNHYILCGAGESGSVIVEKFLKKKMDFVVIEINEDIYKELIQRGIPAILGDATQEEVLEHANIRKAKGLISALSSDVDNLFTVLTARQMNKDLYIVSRAIDKTAPNKLKKAGADNTVSPNEIGGRRMAALMMRSSVISFLDIITQVGNIELDLEDVIIPKKSPVAGKSLKEIDIPEQTGLILLAVQKKGDEQVMFNPILETIIDEGDTLIVLGEEGQVKKCENVICGLK